MRESNFSLISVNPGYQVKDGNVFYTKGNSRREKVLFVNETQISALKGCGTFFITGNSIVSFFWDIGIVIFDFQGNIIKQFNNYSISSLVINNEYFTIRDTSNNTYHRVSCTDFNTIGVSSINYIFQKNDFGFIIENNILSAFSIKNGNKIWEHGISSYQLATVPKFLGITNNKIFILLNLVEIIVLNTQDGSLVKTINSDQTFLTVDTFMHPDNHHIYCLHNKFTKINTETLEIEVVKQIVTPATDKNSLNILEGIKSSSFQGKYISFTSFTNLRSGFAKWIGFFDYEIGKIVWHYEVLPSGGQLSFGAGETPKLAADKIYILDTENILHVMKSDI